MMVRPLVVLAVVLRVVRVLFRLILDVIAFSVGDIHK